jgi:phosphatidylglycerol:prolipoprotein diacylglycerol transferase
MGLAWIVHDFSPFAVDAGNGQGLRWYSLAYPAGLLIALVLFIRWKIQGWLSLAWWQLALFWILIVVPGAVWGGRMGYCLIYNLSHTLQHPDILFDLAQGGMSSHGGIVGLLFGAWLFARVLRLSFLRLGDALSLAAPPAIFLGRLGNFMNSELVGRPSEVAWAVLFTMGPQPVVPRHPSQLYEAFLEGIVLGVVLWWAKRKWPLPGSVLAILLLAYPVLRCVGECFREPDIGIGYLWMDLTAGQWLSLVLLLPGLLLANRLGILRKT